MKKLIIGIGILFVGLLILISTGFFEGLKQGIAIGVAESMPDGFKSGFMKSCIGSDNSSQKSSFCECIADEAVRKLTLEQMKDVEVAQKFIFNEIAPVCNEKVYGKQN